ncbi:RNA-directed DNA polymerase, eukaryota [Tanacetum coccineum]
MVDGDWVDIRSRVKVEFYSHFANRFSTPDWTRVPFDTQFPQRLDVNQACDLEREVSNEEIKRAVWDCGSDKSPGPDGFTFQFFKNYWSTVGVDVINVVKELFRSSTFPNGCNSSFIALIPKVLGANQVNDFHLIGCQYKIIGKILANRLSLVIDGIISQEQSTFIKGRQIMDGPLILNEDHINDILYKLGFGFKWRSWIRGCVFSSKASVLVNGLPTDEFFFHRGLRQRDPLSPFLFILVMESLHVSFQQLIDRRLFTPIVVGKDNVVPISHLLYVDDVMFIGKWSSENVNVLMMMLHWFFLASGLKINVQKSSLYGVGVRPSEVHSMAECYGCLANNLPFTYLGVKVGANMSRVNSWNEVVQKVTNKLSTWKAKTLSVGGRLILIKSVLGVIPTYYMSMFKVPEGVLSHLESLRNSFFLGADLEDRKITSVCWRKAMANKHLGGLGVSSLFALNHALLFKWIWHFRSSQTGLWLNVIKVIHGIDGAIDSPPRYVSSVWNKIFKATFSLKSKGVDLLQYCKIVIGDGSYFKFWHDVWLADVRLKDKFNRCFKLDVQQHASIALKLQNQDFAYSFRRRPRSGIEEAQFQELSNMLASVTLSSAKDRWSWSLVGSGVFSVKSAREEIDKHMLLSSPSPTRWSKVLPIKINVFLWRMFLDKTSNEDETCDNSGLRREPDVSFLWSAIVVTKVCATVSSTSCGGVPVMVILC